MNEKTKQQLSMLLDGELDFEQALILHDRMDSEPELQALWHRQNLISQALKTEPLTLGGEDFVNQVSEAIQAEPTVLVPKRRRTYQVPKTALAVAASVACLALFVFNYMPKGISPPSSDLMIAESPSIAKPRPLLARVEPSYDARFNEYLVSHQQGSLTPGMLSHARIVSYSVGQ